VSLRVRIAAAAGVAVTLAVLGAAIGLYVAVRSDLRSQIDESLTQRARVFVAAPPPGADTQLRGSEGFPAGAPLFGLRARSGAQGPLPKAVQPARFGGASGYVQFVSAAGAVDAPRGQGATPQIPPTARDRAIRGAPNRWPGS
jgi:hypothetical protein